MISLAIGIPHAAHRPERAESMRRAQMPWIGHGYEDVYCQFTEREPHWEWSRRMWKWAANTGATHFVTVQDDTISAPYALDAVRAMIEARPNNVIGLAAVHPYGPELARQGHRWYRTERWLPGWGMIVPIDTLRQFLPWCEANLDALKDGRWGGEDFFLSKWLYMNGHDINHPIPTVVDHDTSLDSTSEQGDHNEHLHRHSSVTWRAYAKEDLCDPDYWRSSPGPLLTMAPAQMCWSCLKRKIQTGSKDTGVGVCATCMLAFVGALMGVPITFQAKLEVETNGIQETRHGTNIDSTPQGRAREAGDLR